jgi:DNA-directed RNA polymerase subunit L
MMEVEFTKKSENHLEFTLKGEKHTYPNLLKTRLLQDKDVEFASYVQDHPYNNEAKFVVKTGKKPAKKAVLDAIAKIDSELEELGKAVKKSLK